MAVTKKTAIGGTVLGGSSIGAGFGISKLAEKLPINEQLKERISLVKETFNFDIDSYECTNSLRVEENDEPNYKLAFIACTQSKTLADLARRIGLDVLSKENKFNSGLFGGDNHKEEVLRITGIQEGSKVGNKKEGGKIVHELGNEVASGCEKQEFSTDTKDEQGHNFLIACTKNGKIGGTGVKREIRLQKINDGNEKKFMNGHTKGNVEKHLGIRAGIPKVTPVGTSKVDERDEYLSRELGEGREKLNYKIKTFGFKLENENETECKNSLQNELNEENFKTAVRACFKNKKFSDRAKALGFRVVPETVQDDDGKFLGGFARQEKHGRFGEAFENIKNSFKTRIKEGISNMETTDTGSVDQPKIKAHCDSKNKTISTTFTEQEGQKYLKNCTKNKPISLIIPDKGEKAINFGTGKYTETVSN